MEIRKLLFIILILICLDCKLTDLNNPSDTKTKAYLETALWNCVFRLVPCYEITQQNNGIKQWTRLLGGSSSVSTNSFTSATDFDGNNYIAGKVDGALPGQSKVSPSFYTDLFLAKYNTVGDLLWVRQLGSSGNYTSDAQSIHVDSFGDIIVTGLTQGSFGEYTSTEYGLVLVKYSQSGEKLWTKVFYGNSGSIIAGAGVTSDLQGNIYVTGYTQLTNINGEIASGIYNLILFKYDRTGNLLWTRVLAETPGSLIYGFNITYDRYSNQIFVCGHATGPGTFLGQTIGNTQESFIAAFREDGVNTWAKKVGQSLTTVYARGVSSDHRGNVYLTGELTGLPIDGQTFSGTTAEVLIKYNVSGNREWTKLRGAGSGKTTISRGVYADNAGNVYTTGWTNGNLSNVSLNGTQDVYFSKYHFNGNLEWTRLSGSASVTLDGMGLSSDRYGTIFLTGGTTGNFDGKVKTGTKDAFVIQYK
ncbi:SBBP repeat-containing protein [Leptospira sp. 85282-16]|uniref:SBBP repeat-containing protein n=1 Tax=Leptospira sp. 85282-16 TaxID=2971256 RepID=UPI0021C13D10|nr:SBBP repeat-containing protein [Leptospira sp. 85282-16]MCT8333998.1 SBBP repeat-containing protein [Leptospira sp. 85282-16]